MDNPLAFEVTVPAQQHRIGAPMAVRLQLVNVGSDFIVVNNRLAISGSASTGDVHLRAEGPDGRAVPFIADVNVGRPHAADFGKLGPSRLLGRQYELSHYLLLAEPGPYRVTATYRNAAGAPGLDFEAWTGELEATPVDLMLV